MHFETSRNVLIGENPLVRKLLTLIFPCLPRYLDAKSEREECGYPIYIFGDETFVVQLKGFIVDIWRFDKHVRMAREDPRFSKRREAFSQLEQHRVLKAAPSDLVRSDSAASSDFEPPAFAVRLKTERIGNSLRRCASGESSSSDGFGDSSDGYGYSSDDFPL